MKYVLSQDELTEAIHQYLVNKKVLVNSAGHANVHVRIHEGVRKSWMREPSREVITTFQFTPDSKF